MAKSILEGVGEIIDSGLGLAGGSLRASGTSRHSPKAPPTDFDAQILIDRALEKIEDNWHGSHSQSKENWRREPNTEYSPTNTSLEVLVERLIARTPQTGWANQVPVASGLTTNRAADKRCAIDLVHRSGPRRYEFIELKVKEKTGRNPLFAAREVLQYGILYIFSRKHHRTLANRIADKSLFKAARIHLKVLAPAEYYVGYNLAWLDERINAALASYTAKAKCGFKMDFTYEALSLVPSGSPVSWKANH